MSWLRFQDYAGLPKEEAQTIVKNFRANNPKVVNMWRRFDSVIAVASRDKDRHMALELPTGDLLQYFNVRAKSDGGFEGFVTKGDFGALSRQPRLWGGTLTENVTQRMA